jgi:hypothetical protein
MRGTEEQLENGRIPTTSALDERILGAGRAALSHGEEIQRDFGWRRRLGIVATAIAGIAATMTILFVLTGKDGESTGDAAADKPGPRVSVGTELGGDSVEDTSTPKGSLGWLGMTYFEAIKTNDLRKLRQCWPTVEEVEKLMPTMPPETDRRAKALRDGSLRHLESLQAELPELLRRIRESGTEMGIVWEKAEYHSMVTEVWHRRGHHSMPDATIYFACPGIEGTMYSLKTDDGGMFPAGWRFGDRPNVVVEKAGRLPYPR